MGAAAANDETLRAWDGPLFDRWVRFREVVTDGMSGLGEAAIARYPPRPGSRVLDIGCGLGDTTLRLAGLVGPDGHATGVDVAPRFVAAAREAAASAGAENVGFQVRDVQVDPLGGPYELAFSRFGTMFFASPVAALRNVRAALAPGGRLVMVVWRRREDNAWLHRAQTIVEGIVQRPDEHDEPTCGPGPFSMADADTTSAVVRLAGLEDVVLHRCDQDVWIGRDLDEAIALVMALGPAGEILRLAGDRAAHLHARADREVRAGMAEFVGPDGVRAPASTWIVSATAPGQS